MFIVRCGKKIKEWKIFECLDDGIKTPYIGEGDWRLPDPKEYQKTELYKCSYGTEYDRDRGKRLETSLESLDNIKKFISAGYNLVAPKIIKVTTYTNKEEYHG